MLACVFRMCACVHGIIMPLEIVYSTSSLSLYRKKENLGVNRKEDIRYQAGFLCSVCVCGVWIGCVCVCVCGVRVIVRVCVVCVWL